MPRAWAVSSAVAPLPLVEVAAVDLVVEDAIGTSTSRLEAASSWMTFSCALRRTLRASMSPSRTTAASTAMSRWAAASSWPPAHSARALR